MKRIPLLFLNVIVIATCGLIYELLAGTLASYVLGDSVTQFSLIIGIYLSAMGLGSWLSGFLDKDLAKRFLEIELAVAVVGGFSAPLLFSLSPTFLISASFYIRRFSSSARSSAWKSRS
jgi:spermidine synthase